MRDYTFTKKPVPMNLKSRLSFYKKEYGKNWREFIKYRDGWTKYGQCPETLSEDRKTLFASYEFNQQIGYADEFVRLDHNGWFEDEDGISGTLRGVVLKIRSAKYTLYVPGVVFSDSQSHFANIDEAFTVPRGSEEDSHDEAIKEAALLADGIAEIEAEKCREHNARYSIECQIEDKQTEIANIRKEVKSLISGIRKSKLDSTLCEHIKKQISGLHNCLRLCINDIEQLREDLTNYDYLLKED